MPHLRNLFQDYQKSGSQRERLKCTIEIDCTKPLDGSSAELLPRVRVVGRNLDVSGTLRLRVLRRRCRSVVLW